MNGLQLHYGAESRGLSRFSSPSTQVASAVLRVPASLRDCEWLTATSSLCMQPWTSALYHGTLRKHGVRAECVVDPAASHAWIAAAPELVVAWVREHGSDGTDGDGALLPECK